jgi:hypothetical protein
MTAPPGIVIQRLRSVDDDQIEGLAELLIDCVDGGASVSFMHPLAPAKAQAFWRRIAADVEAGRRALLIAENESGIVGTVQLVLDQPENQAHRADLSKMLVHRRAAGEASARRSWGQPNRWPATAARRCWSSTR